MSIYACIMLVYVAVTAAIELLAIWVAAKPHALLPRALVLWGAILLLLPIGAFDAALLLTVSAAMTIGIVSGIRRLLRSGDAVRTRVRRRWRFSLADIVVVTLFVATFFALARESPAMRSLEHGAFATFGTVLAAAPIAAIAVLAHYAAVGPARITMGLLAALVAMLSATHFHAGRAYGYFWEVSLAYGLRNDAEAYWLLIPLYLLLFVMACAALSVRLLRGDSATPSSSWRRRTGLALVILSLTIGLPLAWILWELAWGRLISAGTLKGISVQAVPLLLLGVAIFVVTWICRAIWQTEVWSHRWRVGSAIAASILVGLPASWLYWQMLWLAPFPLVAYEQPNNYDAVVAIAMQVGNPYASPGRHPMLDEAVVLLQAPSHIPMAVVEAEIQNRQSPQRAPLLRVRYLAEHLLQAAETSAKLGQPDRGADDAIAILRLGNMLERGGTSLHAAMGDQISGSGYLYLANNRRSLSPAKAREIIAALQRVLDERDDVATLKARDRAHSDRSHGWRGRLQRVLASLRADHQPYEPPYYDQRTFNEAVNLRLQAELAVRVFQHDTGRLPASLAELVPTYLPEIPHDPSDGQPLGYQTDGDDFIVYSVGPGSD